MKEEDNHIEISNEENGGNAIVFAIDSVTVKYEYNKAPSTSLHKIYDLIFDEVYKQMRN